MDYTELVSWAAALEDEERLDEQELKFTESLDSYISDLQKIDEIRSDTKNKLEKVIKHVDDKETIHFEEYDKETIKDLKEYEKVLREETKKLSSIAHIATQIISNEKDEVLYDINQPFKIYSTFIEILQKFLNNVKMSSRDATTLNNIIKSIAEAYDNIMKQTEQILGRGIYTGNRTNSGILMHKDRRATIKKEINTKAKYISGRIVELEKKIQSMKTRGTLSEETSTQIIEIVTLFKDQFLGKHSSGTEQTGLAEYCLLRIQLAENRILETIKLQNEKLVELTEIGEELKKVYTEVKETEVKEEKTLKSDEKIPLEVKKDFAEHEREVEIELKSLKEQAINVEKVKEEFVKSRQADATVIKETVVKTNGFKRRILKLGVALAITVSTISMVTPTISKSVNTFPDVNRVRVMDNIKLSDAGCAAYVIEAEAQLHNLGKTFTTNVLGITGNAWTMFENMEKRGGEVIINMFDKVSDVYASQIDTLRIQIKQDYENTLSTSTDKSDSGKDKIYAQLNQKYAASIRNLFPDRVDVNTNNLRVGDVVGLYYSISDNQVKAFMNADKGTFNTHLGMVTAVGEGYTQITHFIHDVKHQDYAEKILVKNNSSNIMIMWVMRPSKVANMTFKEEMGEKIDDSNSVYKIKQGFAKTRFSVRFMNTLSDNFNSLSKDFNLSSQETIMLSKIAFGILGRETTFSEGKTFHVKTFFDRASLRAIDVSRGPTQLKVHLMNPDLLQKYDITKSNIDNPDKCALATFCYLAGSWNALKTLGHTGDDLVLRTIISWNIGPKAFTMDNPADYKYTATGFRKIVEILTAVKYGFTGEDYYKEVMGWQDLLSVK